MATKSKEENRKLASETEKETKSSRSTAKRTTKSKTVSEDSDSGEESPAPKAKPVAAPAKRKLCRIISYEKMSPEVKALFDEKYKDGFEDYVTRYPKPNGEYFFAVGLDTEDTDYLVKVEVEVDVDVDIDSDDDDDVIEGPTDVEVAAEDDEDVDESESRRGGDASDYADSIADEPSDNE